MEKRCFFLGPIHPYPLPASSVDIDSLADGAPNCLSDEKFPSVFVEEVSLSRRLVSTVQLTGNSALKLL